MQMIQTSSTSRCLPVEVKEEDITSEDQQQGLLPPKENGVDKEMTRKEIRNLRHTRDALVQQRQELDERQHRVFTHKMTEK